MTQEPDVEVFCDDVPPMPSNGIAIGLGIAPRLRLPLPDTVSPAFKAHVARHTGPRDNRYAYHRSDQPLSVAASHVRHHSGPTRCFAALAFGRAVDRRRISRHLAHIRALDDPAWAAASRDWPADAAACRFSNHHSLAP
ncbi:MAG: hypothetical protein JJU24_16315 [Natronohydrobacter sp.]|nr:hypothetical protein [Natronohydrobacter sp.]